MRYDYRQLFSLAAVIGVTAAAFLYLPFDDSYSGTADRQSIDLALVQEMLSSGERTHSYRLIPDSVMTGLCWRTGDGDREGVFRDVNAGMALWRDHAPAEAGRQAPDQGRPAPADTGTAANYAALSHQLERMSFEATSYDLTDLSARVTGLLLIGEHSREVVLEMRMPAARFATPEQNLIELNAATELAADDLGNVALATGRERLNLCIRMQAVRESVLPDSNADEPLMLSHYYLQ